MQRVHREWDQFDPNKETQKRLPMVRAPDKPTDKQSQMKQSEADGALLRQKNCKTEDIQTERQTDIQTNRKIERKTN